ncbi:phospholipase [Nucisporomicrobium flavum]|uniref:phospholipase n=1 Tax=Nucisporomicrobium flavum TaxID=2785915 RepID=UPI0018F3BFA6|nr:phospholipase [Nucisporomicrobium flavum]
MNRSPRRLLVVLISTLALLLPAAAAHATESKASVLSSWTQTTATSTNAWNAARLNREQWASYNFDWSTDYCSSSPDNPLGFDFKLSCWHHDFGYRNYKDLGTFDANKSRLDSMFYADLKRKCATYSVVVQPACYSLAWTYYQAVSIFGSLEAVNPSDVDRARALVG